MAELPRELGESSGLVASRRHPGVFWTHNDSGDKARLFAIDGRGKVLARVKVRGAEAVDWEDIAMDDEGRIWIGDVGNNTNTRKDLTVYRVPEPKSLKEDEVEVDRKVRFRFPDQHRFPDPTARNFDAEGLFFDDGTLWLFSKHRSDQQTTLYRFPKTKGEVELERIGDFELGGDPDRFGGMATAADLSPDGGSLALLSYHAIFLFHRGETGWFDGEQRRIALDQIVTGQCEGLAWSEGALWFTNEDRSLFRVDEPWRAERFPEP